MRICLFTDSFLPYISGVSTAVFNQANELASRGHEVSIFHPRAKRSDRQEPVPGLHSSIRTYGLPLSVGVSNVPKLRLSIPLFIYAYRRLKQAAPDLIHVHSEFGCGLEGMLLGRWKRVPVIGTFHTFFAEPEYLKQFSIPNFEIVQWTARTDALPFKDDLPEKSAHTDHQAPLTPARPQREDYVKPAGPPGNAEFDDTINL